ncbi:hypothetical protein GGF46_000952 [Coemansia sp. RSA 552]|nr:hypothetical protein GGF46_000952 [Coemansia sp. RSA 552]
MDVRALLDVPHRSVHWALLKKLREQAVKDDGGFGEWKKLLTWEVAGKAPHVFSEALDQTIHLVLAGKANVVQATQLLSQLVSAPQTGKRHMNTGPTTVSLVVQALVRLQAAGADQLMPGRGARDNMLRPALEHNPALWILAVRNIRQCLSDSADFADTWASFAQFLGYAVTDPTVPVWAQNKTVDMLFAVLHEAIPARQDAAFVILEWVADIAAGMAPPIAPSGASAGGYFEADMQGRCDQLGLVLLCTGAVESLGAAGKLSRLAPVVGRLRLLTASLGFTDLPSSLAISQAQSPRIASHKNALAETQVRLLDISIQLLKAQAKEEQRGNVLTDIVVWVLVATRVANATSSAEQSSLLQIIETIFAQHQLLSQIPAQVVALIDMPLLCVAVDGFTPELCSWALRLREDLDQTSIPPSLGSAEDVRDLQSELGELAESKWATGMLPLLLSNIHEYLEVIPCLASTADAYATSRVVSVYSDLWKRTGSSAKGLRLRGLVVRGWMNVVKRNPRVWQDLRPVLSQFVEAKKAQQYAPPQQGGVYEWAVLATIRDLVRFDPGRYTEEMLPFVFSLLSYATERLGAESTALLIDTAGECVDSGAAEVRSVWATIVVKPAELWIPQANRLVMESLARFFKLIATHGENTDVYMAFRQDVLAHHLAPLCQESAPMRGLFLAALAAYPVDEVQPLLTGSTPGQFVHALLVQESQGMDVDEIVRRAASGKMLTADILVSLMDNEVRFMRRSLLRGTSTFARTDDDDGSDGDDGDGGQHSSAQHQWSWARSNLERSRWVNDILSPILSKARAQYWTKEDHRGGLASELALATMISSVPDPEQLSSDQADVDSENEAEGRAEDNDVQLAVAHLKALLTDVQLLDHWCLRACAVDGWQIWMGKLLTAVTSDGTAMPAVASDLLAELKDVLESSHIPAQMENALYAVAGLIRAIAALDREALASEVAMRAGLMLTEQQQLPYTMAQSDEFWLSAGPNDGVLAAAIECAAQVAIANSHDQATLSQIAQFLMAGLAAGRGPLVAQALGRALTQLHMLLVGQTAAHPSTYSDDLLAIEADDIRRCVERLEVLQPTPCSSSVGQAALAQAQATMHRYWISRIINPAMAERNSTPQASQAVRTIARALGTALDGLSSSDPSRWVPSLYYLSFVWPPRPITQRHVELHPELLVVTPERTWQAVVRLVRKLSDTDVAVDPELLSLAEIAQATLAYHMVMTTHARATTAHSTHTALLRQYSSGDSTSGANMAANERSILRTNRLVALAILLGVPVHGVPETTVSSRFAGRQHACQPVLLGIGSVKFGSTGWLRAKEPLLQGALGALVGCAGMDRVLEEDAAAEITDFRAARTAAFVLGALASQSAQATRVLVAEQEQNTDMDAPEAPAATQDLAAAAEEPKSLSHLPASTSWCRAVWENICELSESLDEGEVLETVERRLACLLAAMLGMARPFPVVDMRKVFQRLVSVGQNRLKTRQRAPLLLLAVRVASRLGRIIYSAAHALEDAVRDITRYTVGLLVAAPASQWYAEELSEDSVLGVSRECLGAGLSLLLELVGLPSDGWPADTDRASWTAVHVLGRSLTEADTVRLAGTTSLCAKDRLKAAVLKSAVAVEREPEAQVESDAERMFRVMSKVAISTPKAVSLCTALFSQLFATEAQPPPLFSLQMQMLATLQAHIAESSLASQEVTGEAARAKITAEVAGLSLGAAASDKDRRAITWATVGVTCCGTNADHGTELLATDLHVLSGQDLPRAIGRQALVLQHWIADARVHRHSCSLAELRSSQGPICTWLKRVFKDLGRRPQSPADTWAAVSQSLQEVALALFAGQPGRVGDVEAREWIVQGLDLAILASLGERTADIKSPCADRALAAVLVGWLLPLLTGYCVDKQMQRRLVGVAAGELVEHIEHGSSAEGQRARQYSVKLRSRVQGLLDLVESPASARPLRQVLANLAVLGKLPETDLWRIDP